MWQVICQPALHVDLCLSILDTVLHQSPVQGSHMR